MANVDCPRCGAHNEAGAQFCEHCGADVAPRVPCPTCNQLQPLGARFCTGCGVALSEAGVSMGPADGAVFDGVWERSSDEFIRRVDADDCRTFLGNRVVRVPPGTVGIVLIDGIVERVLPPGERTTVNFFERISNFFTGRPGRTAFYLVDQRPILVPFTVQTQPSSTGRTVHTQILASFRLPRGDKAALATFIANLLGDRAGLAAGDLYNLLRPEVVSRASAVLNRLAATGDVRIVEAEGEIGAGLRALLGARYGLDVDVDLAPLAAIASLDLHLGTDAVSLFTADGQPVEIDLVVRVQGHHDDFGPDSIGSAVAAGAAAHLRRVALADLAGPEALVALEQTLGGDAARSLQSFGLNLVSLSVVDVRTKTGQWMLGARAEIDRARAELTVDREWLAHTDDQIDLAGLTLAQTLRRHKVDRDHAIAARRAGQAAADADAELDAADARRDAGRELEAAAARRRVEHDARAARHATQLDVLQHDGELARQRMALEAERRRVTTDLDSERSRRLADDAAYAARVDHAAALDNHTHRAELDGQIADWDQSRQLEKLRSMAELDRQMAEQEHAQRLALRAGLAGLTEREMIAAQAVDLAQTEGGGAAWAQALSGQETAKVLGEQLARAQALTERVMAQTGEQRRDQGAAEIAARAVDAMSRVTAARVAPAPAFAAVAADHATSTCAKCDAALRPDARFCGACGVEQ